LVMMISFQKFVLQSQTVTD